MGLHTDTRIYKTSTELFEVATLAIRNMPRDVKIYMGTKIRDELLEAIGLIYEANVAKNKAPHIEAIRGRIQRVELLLRQSVDLAFITKPAYAKAIALTQSIGRQATGWLKHSASQAPAT